jgi:hypothetical protein
MLADVRNESIMSYAPLIVSSASPNYFVNRNTQLFVLSALVIAFKSSILPTVLSMSEINSFPHCLLRVRGGVVG